MHGARMAYIRYKLPEPTHKIMRKVGIRLGMKDSEISRIAVMEYLKTLGILGDKVRRPSIMETFITMKPHKREALLEKIKNLRHEKVHSEEME
jgi:hypothetical protein